MLFYRLDGLSLKLLPYEHRVLRELKKRGLYGRTIVVAVSGGLDSVFLLLTLYRLRLAAKLDLHVAHVHHGAAALKQKKFRDSAENFVRQLSEELKIPFHTNRVRPRSQIKSEADLRNFRYRQLDLICKKLALSHEPLLATAHHQDDLIETQLMRLVRGTGSSGISAIHFLSDAKLRPLLFMRRNEIKEQARLFKLKWLDDPSNKKLEPLRNWMRQVWLPMLEKKVPGSTFSLARSLAHLSPSDKGADEYFRTGAISRRTFLSLEREKKSVLIVQYIRHLKINSYTQGQVEEILKRLDNGQVEYTFTILKHKWIVNAEQILAHKL